MTRRDEAPIERWTRQVFEAFRDHEVQTFDELPDLEQTRLHLLAAEVWPAAGRMYGQLVESASELPPEARDRSKAEQLASELGAEMVTSPSDAIEIADYAVAIRNLEEIWAVGTSPSTRSPFRYTLYSA